MSVEGLTSRFVISSTSPSSFNFSCIHSIVSNSYVCSLGQLRDDRNLRVGTINVLQWPLSTQKLLMILTTSLILTL